MKPYEITIIRSFPESCTDQIFSTEVIQKAIQVVYAFPICEISTSYEELVITDIL